MEQVDVLLTLKRWDRFSSESLYLLMFTRTLLRRTFPPSFSFPSSPSSLPRQQWPFLFADKPKDTGFFLKIFLLIGLVVCLFSYLPWNATQSLITDLLRKKKWQMVWKLKETTRQNYYLSFLTKIRFVTRINLSVITREIIEKRRQTLNKTSGA